MKKMGLLFVSLALLGLITGCEAIKDATEVEYTVYYSHTYTVNENLTTYPYNVDLEDSEDYRKYKGHIRNTEIEFVRYSITSNTGGGGKVDLYANFYGGPFSSATKVAGPISFAAGETRGVTEVVWVNKGYFESLLSVGELSVWAVAEGTNVRLTLPVELKVKLTVTPFE